MVRYVRNMIVDTLIRLRPIWVVQFFGGLLVALAVYSPDRRLIFQVALLLSFLGLALFSLTEGFGPLSVKKSVVTRWVARIFFVMVSLQVTSGVIQMFWAP